MRGHRSKEILPACSMFPVTLEKDTLDFVFDTGANFSVIMESLANKYGVKIVGGMAGPELQPV